MHQLSEREPDANASQEEHDKWMDRQHQAATKLGAMRGKSRDEALAEWSDYQELRQQQEHHRMDHGLEAVPQLSEKNRDHMGSVQQLRSGSYVGETLGVDDAYGALLNPTGGLVGPGNKSYSAHPNAVASFHGEAHDAFGYLRNYHSQGPGYQYASPERAKRSGHKFGSMAPATGQASGFKKWNDLLAERGRADPHHPGDVDKQMQRSAKRLAIGDAPPASDLPPAFRNGFPSGPEPMPGTIPGTLPWYKMAEGWEKLRDKPADPNLDLDPWGLD